MAKKGQTIEEIIEKKVSKLREEEKAKNEELIQIQEELRMKKNMGVFDRSGKFHLFNEMDFYGIVYKQ